MPRALLEASMTLTSPSSPPTAFHSPQDSPDTRVQTFKPFLIETPRAAPQTVSDPGGKG